MVGILNHLFPVFFWADSIKCFKITGKPVEIRIAAFSGDHIQRDISVIDEIHRMEHPAFQQDAFCFPPIKFFHKLSKLLLGISQFLTGLSKRIQTVFPQRFYNMADVLAGSPETEFFCLGQFAKKSCKEPFKLRAFPEIVLGVNLKDRGKQPPEPAVLSERIEKIVPFFCTMLGQERRKSRVRAAGAGEQHSLV